MKGCHYILGMVALLCSTLGVENSYAADSCKGYECPEERDYYPYWRPTEWRDVAVTTDVNIPPPPPKTAKPLPEELFFSEEGCYLITSEDAFLVTDPETAAIRYPHLAPQLALCPK